MKIQGSAEKKIIVLDVETTGLGIEDRIVSLAAIRSDRTELQDDFLHLIFNPGIDSHPEAARIHGWEREITDQQELFSEHAAKVHQWLSWADAIVTHNTAFDMRFINSEFRRAGLAALNIPTLCTMMHARNIWSGSSSLDACLKRIESARAGSMHSALEDVFLTMNLFRWFNKLPLLKLKSSLPMPANFRHSSGGTPREKPAAADLPPPSQSSLDWKELKNRIPPESQGLWTAKQRSLVEKNCKPIAVAILTMARSGGKDVSEYGPILTELVRDSSRRLGFSHSLHCEIHVMTKLLQVDVQKTGLTAAARAIVSDAYAEANLPNWLARVAAADGRMDDQERAAALKLRDSLDRAKESIYKAARRKEKVHHDLLPR